MMAKNRAIQHFSKALHVTSLVPTGFKICSWQENDFWEKLPVDEYYMYFFFSFLYRKSRSCTVPEINLFLHFTQKFKTAAKNGGKEIFVKCCQSTLQIPCGSKISSKSLYLTPFPIKMHFCVLRRNSRWPPHMAEKQFYGKVTNRLCIYSTGQKFRQN